MNSGFSGLCEHSSTKRVNENFIRCNRCGISLINQSSVAPVKSSQDFVKNNKSFERNFDRNFSNVIEEVDLAGPSRIEYYVNPNDYSYVVIDWTPVFNANPLKYMVNFNGQTTTMTEKKIKEILSKIRATKIDKEQFKQMFRQL